MSLVVTGANEHDLTQLDAVLQAIVVKRKRPSQRRSKHLCADGGYRGRRALQIIESHGYIPHVVDRSKEADAKRRDPTKRARRWGVEVCHSWFNRFRKLLVRYEKLERSFVALIRKVSLWLGHASIQTTEMYTRADPSIRLESLEATAAPCLRSGRFVQPTS
ncbi:putative transposase [Variovorax paradoxus B4]|uniref:Putative transposase n=1 Tax=Variovorax paradoxus B4 TaxID=1246301 RepID=T1XMS2_VARPD|nr:putative transposase [Variovorax paradoxus B4]